MIMQFFDKLPSGSISEEAQARPYELAIPGSGWTAVAFCAFDRTVFGIWEGRAKKQLRAMYRHEDMNFTFRAVLCFPRTRSP